MRVRLLTAIALVVTLSACFSAKSPATSPSGIPPPEAGLAPSIFPHKADWNDPAQHGVYVKDVLNMDATNCLGCHAETQSVSGGAPTCRSCHKLFPHTEPGVTKETHGDYVLKNGKADCATKCHGTDLKGGLSGKPCTECHKAYPHDAGWSAPGTHGPEAKGDLKTKNECNLCHGDDWKGGKSKTSCIDCHKGSYPHPTGWASPDQHGAFASTNGTGKCATQCHGVQLDGGLSGVSCKDGCHKVWPHPASGWMAIHGQTARSIKLSGCMGCHKNDATGGKTGVSCTKCHASLPAHQDANWDKAGHGTLVMKQPATLTDNAGCTLCHGAKLEGGKAPTLPGLKALQGCKDCHASYPTLHKPVAGLPAWNTYDGHAKWVIGQIKPDNTGTYANVLNQINALLVPCKLCHGNDLKGGNTGVGCTNSKCHSNFPHDMDPATTPWLSKHGAAANAENPKAASCATANCHGQDMQGLPTGEKIVAKKLVKGCTDCHIQMPHKPLGQWDHGNSKTVTYTISGKQVVVLDAAACVDCHGKTWTGKNDAPSCYDSKCHTTFPKPHRNDDGTINTAWKPGTGHGPAVMAAYKSGSVKNTAAAPCKVCHGSDLTGGASSKTCYKCHKSFPHAAAPVTVGAVTYTFTDATWDGLSGFANSHGSYVMAQAAVGKVSSSQQSNTECGKTCHGTDLLGGTSGISCYNCHKSFPHAADWWKVFNAADAAPGGSHGTYVKANGNSGCLKGCHTIDLPGGSSKTACATCHAPYPHPPTGVADWKAGHKGYINQLAANKATTPFAVITSDCTPCHISATKNDCSSCHHKNVADWKTKGQHGVKATTDIAGCKSCHGPDLNNGTLTNTKTCATCHGPGTKATLTSHQNTIKVDTYYDQCCKDCIDDSGATWDVANQAWLNCADCNGNAYYDCGDPKQKTVIVADFVNSTHKTNAKNDLKSCQICHGDDFKGGISGKACFSCHNPGGKYPHTKLGPDTTKIWSEQIATITVPKINTLPGSMTKNCFTACHNYIVLKADGTKALPNKDCFDCHKNN